MYQGQFRSQYTMIIKTGTLLTRILNSQVKLGQNIEMKRNREGKKGKKKRKKEYQIQ